MIKKSVFLGLFFCLVATWVAVAQYKTELLAYFDQGQEGFWTYTAANPNNKEEFDSGVFATLHVPPCPKCEAVVFEIYAQVVQMAEYPNSTYLDYNCDTVFKIISDVIPPNIEVSSGLNIFEARGVQGQVQAVLNSPRANRVRKMQLTRNYLKWWNVFNTVTGQYLPAAEAIPILNKLINRGFDVEFSYHGYTQGIVSFWAGTFSVYISSIERK